ncbi:hypothetical protein KFE25_001137 [Diacronema lutheri]|uniref:Uncharacterized protein n=2 Tax=Diacronema lutheri TaxID=2081491 RepID=A0A8J5XD48_DIALT|nr:hypothetical protein KFE25_001137 [Diacronema lutheri]
MGEASRVAHLLVDGCNLGLRLVVCAAGRCELLPSHGRLARGRSDSTLLRTAGVMRTLGELAHAGSGSHVHVVIDGKASGGALAGTSWRCRAEDTRAAAAGCALGATEPGAHAKRAGGGPTEVHVSVTAFGESADERIAHECARLIDEVRHVDAAALPARARALAPPSLGALASAMGWAEATTAAAISSSTASPSRRRPPAWWVALRLRRVAGGRAPSASLLPFGLATRPARTLLLRPGLHLHDSIALRCLRALDPSLSGARGVGGPADPVARAPHGSGRAAAGGDELRGGGACAPAVAPVTGARAGGADGATPAVQPFELSLERLVVSPVLVLTRDLALAQRCAALGALCSGSLSDLTIVE